MKKLVLLIIILCMAATALFCGEGIINNNLSLATYTSLEVNGMLGSSVEFGFPIYRFGEEKDSWAIRNNILFNVSWYDPVGAITLTDKISLGGYFKEFGKFFAYGFIEGGLGVFPDDLKNYFALPLLIELKGGGGVDIYMSKGFALMVECGGGYSMTSSQRDVYEYLNRGIGFINIGFKNYF